MQNIVKWTNHIWQIDINSTFGCSADFIVVERVETEWQFLKYISLLFYLFFVTVCTNAMVLLSLFRTTNIKPSLGRRVLCNRSPQGQEVCSLYSIYLTFTILSSVWKRKVYIFLIVVLITFSRDISRGLRATTHQVSPERGTSNDGLITHYLHNQY